MAFLANLFRTSPEEELVNKATDELLISHDWAANLEIADVVNNAADEAVAAEVVRAVRKRLQHRERRVLLLSLELLESLMKNCHEPLHSQVGTADFLGELSRLALASRTAGEVAQRALALIDSWGVAFQGHPRLTEFHATYRALLAQGVEFPARDLDQMSPFYTPAAQPSAPLPLAGGGRGGGGGSGGGGGRGGLSSSPEPTALQLVPDDPLPSAAPPAARPAAPLPPGATTAHDDEEAMLQRALSLSLEEADPVAASEASAAADEAARAARAVAAVEELQRIEGDVATLTANVALFSECLAAAGEEPAEVLANEVLVDMLPSLRESQPRVLRLIEGGEVEDEGLVERLFALHEQLSYCVGKYDELAGAAAPPPPAAAAPAAAPAPAPAGAIFDLDLLSDPDAGNAAFVPVAAAPSLAAATAGAIARPAALPGEDLLFTGGMGHLADAAPLTTRDDEGGAPSDEAHGPPPTEPPPPPPGASAAVDANAPAIAPAARPQSFELQELQGGL